MGTTITLTSSRDTVVITGDGVFSGPTYDALIGWYDVGADLRFERRPSAPGAFAPERAYADALTVSIEGQFYGATRGEALAMRERLTGLYDDGLSVTMTVTDDLRTTSRQVHIESVTFPWTIHQQIGFAIDAKAADPRRYGTGQTDSTTLRVASGGLEFPLVFPLDFGGDASSGGRVVTINSGNSATVTTFTVSAGQMLDGFELVNVATGQRVTYVGPVVSGTAIVVDFAARVAFINGTTPAGRYLSSPQWWSVLPDSSLEVAFVALGAVTGTPTLTALTASAYH